MKINGNNRIFGVNPYQKANQASLDKANKAKMGKDQLQISPEALEMLQSSKTEESDERRTRIEELKKQVQNGSYQVDSRKLADKLYDQLIKGNF